MKKAQAQQQEIELSEDASYRIVALAKAVNTVPEKLLSSNSAFEKAVVKLKKTMPSDPLLIKIPGLREDLGYIFFNRRASFICTQMLQSGQKMRVGVKSKGKSHSYVSTIINTTEDEFWVKPPTVKGKTVNLSKFKSFDFSIFRKNDGEYRFSSKLKSQITTPINALVMEHVSDIKKLHTREHERYMLQFKRKFFFVYNQRKGKQEEQAGENAQCTGTVVDISIGGLKFTVPEIPEKVVEGITVIFKLEEAKIRNEIQAEIVRISTEGGNKSIHLQYQDLSELNRLYLQKFIASKNPVKVK
ncbi:flagellar brake protein [bacterium]|nr:flagellar brake protein [bacterium]